MGSSIRYCTFFLDGLFFGVEVQQVQEVIRYQELTRVPLASRAISGLINLRGQIVTAIDLRQRLGLPARTGDKLPTNVIVRTDDSAVSLLVDEIGDVREVEADAYEPVPPTLRGEARALIHGAYKLPDGLLLTLDTAKAVTLGEDRELCGHAASTTGPAKGQSAATAEHGEIEMNDSKTETPELASEETGDQLSLYERLGGAPAVSAVVAPLADEIVNTETPVSYEADANTD